MTHSYEMSEDSAKGKSELRNRILAIDDEQDITLTINHTSGVRRCRTLTHLMIRNWHSLTLNLDYDLALIDILMQKMDGFALYEYRLTI